MKDRSMNAGLSHRHQDTVDKILNHPASGNIEWRQVSSLLNHIGNTTELHDGKLKVALGPETETFTLPRGKDIDEQMVVDLRRMLTQAGFAPGVDVTVTSADAIMVMVDGNAIVGRGWSDGQTTNTIAREAHAPQ